MEKKRKLFCEYGPIAYKISLFKEAKKKDFIDFKNGKKFAKKKNKENKSKYSNIFKKRTLLNRAKKNIIALLALKKCEC